MNDIHEHERMTRELLSSVGDVFDRYIVFPNQEARDACVLWTAHTWVFKRFEATPRLSVYSSEPGSGKTRVMDLAAGMAPKTMSAVNARPSFLYNAIEESDSIVFTIDEVDTIYGRRGSNNASKQLTAILNDGFLSDGKTMAGSPGSYREISTFTPVAMAGMGRLPDALQSRSIRIPMRKANGRGDVQEYRTKKVKHEFSVVKAVADAWAREVGPYLELIDPEMPVTDRAADKWEPLFTIAYMAGGEWCKRVQRACKLLESNDGGTDTADETGPTVKMLRDIGEFIDDEELTDKDKVYTETVIEALTERGWDTRYINSKAIAKVLATYGVESTTVREKGGKPGKGYYVNELQYAVQHV